MSETHTPATVAVILALVRLPAAEIAWTHEVIDPDPPRDPHCKAAGDLNRDGRLDLLVASDGGDGIVWYEAPRWTKRRIDSGSFTTSMAVGDVDGNGSLDVVVPGSGRGAPVFWYANPLPAGSPASDRWARKVIGVPPGHHDVLVADLDRDGRLDVVARGQSSFGEKAGDAIAVFRQEAGGSWTAGEIRCPHGEGLAVADLDGDGRADIAVNGRWYANPGADVARAAWKERVFAATWTHPDTKVAVGDLDGDGKADIALAPSELAGQRGRISWFRAPADPAAVWSEAVVDGDVECVHHGLALADVDGDGQLDIVTAKMHQGRPPQEIAVFFNGGRGAAWTKGTVAGTGSHNIVVADIDGDGRPDIFGANWNSKAPNRAAIEWWRNRGPVRRP